MLNVTEVKESINKLELKALNLKTKKAKTKCYDKINELRRRLLVHFQDTITSLPTNLTGTVTHVSPHGWFIVECPELKTSIEFYTCSAENTKSWYPETCCIIPPNKGQLVTFEAIYAAHYNGISVSGSKIKGLQLDEALYTKLNAEKGKYAFFKYSNN